MLKQAARRIIGEGGFVLSDSKWSQTMPAFNIQRCLTPWSWHRRTLAWAIATAFTVYLLSALPAQFVTAWLYRHEHIPRAATIPVNNVYAPANAILKSNVLTDAIAEWQWREMLKTFPLE